MGLKFDTVAVGLNCLEAGMEPELKYDDFFTQILQDKKSIVGFLQTVFDFLARRTDFYYESKSEIEGIGFPPGIKEKLVQQVMLQCDPQRATIKQRDELQSEDFDEAPQEACEVEVNADPFEVAAEVCAEADTSENNSEHTAQFASAKQTNNFQPNEYYNGACYENYCWSQSIAEVELHVLLPGNITSAKQLSIDIGADRISIVDKLKPDAPVFGGQLSKKCRSSEAVWSLSNRKLQITLDKSVETWWNQFLDNEPKLDVARMDCSRAFEELPEESQAAIEKMRWDQQQKVLGLPTSEDMKHERILRQAWDAEGSPFKGQPFDPSIVKFN